jgi:secreted trypsin-like serine protease
MAEILRQAKLEVKTSADCGDNNGLFDQDEMICASGREEQSDGKRANSCKGDSGGPLVRHTDNGNELVGIVSYGIGLTKDGMHECGIGSSVFVKVSAYRNWIQTHTP